MTYYRIYEAISTELCTKSGQEPFKYDFLFRQECDSFDQLEPLTQQFDTWYNRERIHSAINYLTPWQKLKRDAKL